MRLCVSIGYLNNGYNGFIAILNGEVTGYLWWVNNKMDPMTNHLHLTRFKFNLKDDEVYWFDFTDIFLMPH